MKREDGGLTPIREILGTSPKPIRCISLFQRVT